MAKQRKGSNVVDLIEPAPERLNVSREAWAKTPGVVRGEIIRAHHELSAGIEKYRPASQRHDDLAEFHDLAKASGKSLADVLRQYLAVERRLREDPHTEMTALITNLGIDPIDFATVIAAGASTAHGSFLKAAADAIRREPDRDWEGMHFGFMAQDVQRVRPECVAVQHNGFLAVDYARLLKTPEARSLPLYSFRYIDGVPKDGVPEPEMISNEVA